VVVVVVVLYVRKGEDISRRSVIAIDIDDDDVEGVESSRVVVTVIAKMKIMRVKIHTFSSSE